ncbi:class I SAM-dependent methyltransferase [Allokutzneria sp. A3M-2-11 16]|nr:class I SAM-dependent methyltransferase [Allokutzneria sp. A3M-2-11 16]
MLELGCAGGVLTGQLLARGADVLAVDREPRLVAIARERLGERARVEVADLERPLDLVPTGSVDLVVASLILHYIEDWTPLFAELRRAGFTVDVVDEPRPEPGPDSDPGMFEVLSTKPVFLYVRAVLAS